MKRILSLLCLAALLLSLTGCGGEKPAAPAETAAPEEVYTARFQDLRFPEGVEPSLWTLTEDGFILQAAVTDEANEAGTLQTVTFTASRPDGTGLLELPVVRYIPGEVSP